MNVGLRVWCCQASGDLYAGRAGAGVVGEAGADQGGLRVGGVAEGGALAPAAGAAGRV